MRGGGDGVASPAEPGPESGGPDPGRPEPELELALEPERQLPSMAFFLESFLRGALGGLMAFGEVKASSR